jgi:PIN domain nuclease of toxin-antitoxin system
VKLLLDAHIWVWTQLEPFKFSSRVRAILSSEENEVWLSPISIWEVTLLAEKGRLNLHPNAYQWIEAALGAHPLKEASLTIEVALARRGIQLPHRDFADLLLAATAKVLGLSLVTADARLLGVRGFSTVANR